ncbi:glycosyltransferase family 2 protein [Microbacter sp. GSS18]|nr:glycosyltransferase family 2 protein [Microbacter sp. GSS18]
MTSAERAAVVAADLSPDGPDGGDRPLLSVVVPTHNVAPWLDETLFSILRQDVERMEIIVVDDHSDDGTVDIVAAAAAADDRIRLIRATARGGGSARNLGIEHARGRYLVFSDGDDLVPDGAYRAMVDSLEASGSDIAIGDYWKFSSARAWHPTASMAGFSRHGSRLRVLDEPTLLMSRPCWNKTFRREFWDREGITFPDAPRSNDIVPMVRSYLRAPAVDVIPDVVYLYRERPGGSSMTSRAGSSTSILSYLTQELECARMVDEADDHALRRVYAALIYDRDGFAALSKYLAARDRSEPADSEVLGVLGELTGLTGAMPPIESLKRITFLLIARGDVRGARGAALLAIEAAGSAREAAVLWTDVIDGVLDASAAHELDDRTLRDGIRHVLASRDPGDPEWFDAWDALRESALRLDPQLVAASVPELMRHPLATPDAVESGRDDDAARITQMRGGRVLHVRGSSAEPSPETAPVLLVADRHGRPRLVRPRRLRWNADGAAWRWEATFAARSVPLYGHAHVAMRHTDGSTIALDSDAPVADQEGYDSVLVDRWGATSWATRRRHWLLRGARIVIEPRARRLLGRLRAQFRKKR